MNNSYIVESILPDETLAPRLADPPPRSLRLQAPMTTCWSSNFTQATFPRDNATTVDPPKPSDPWGLWTARTSRSDPPVDDRGARARMLCARCERMEVVSHEENLALIGAPAVRSRHRRWLRERSPVARRRSRRQGRSATASYGPPTNQYTLSSRFWGSFDCRQEF
mgnify:FL=1